MKLKFVFSLITLCLVSPVISGCSSQESPSSNEVSITGFTSTADGFTSKINNDVDTFSFINKVKVPSNCTWNLYYDLEAANEIVSKQSNAIQETIEHISWLQIQKKQ